MKLKMKKVTNKEKQNGIFIILILLALSIIIFFAIPSILSSKHTAVEKVVKDLENLIDVKEDETPKFTATHIKTPEPLKAVYMSSWVAGTPSIRKGIVQLIEDTELNAIVIDIKDDTGRVSFDVWNEELENIGSEEIRIRDLRDFIALLHSKNIYVIGRISAFQDPYMTNLRPEMAVKRSSDKEVWKDRKGLSWIDASSRPMWDYLMLLADESYNAGFDEINFDYIRFPSDGNMNDIFYPYSEEKINNDPDLGKAIVLESFFQHMAEYFENSDVVLSGDLFGMVTTNSDDLNIGQVLERALPYFDYIAPMVYPSHYPKTFIGLANPAASPYEVIKYSMDSAVKKVDELKSSTTTPDWIREHVRREQLRPWLQDFNLGATYTAEMVRLQMDATYDSGLTSWMLWDASNTYTREALLQN